MYKSRYKKKYKGIFNILIIMIFVSLYFIFINKSSLSSEEAKNMIGNIYKDYEILVTNESYNVNDKYYYTVHANSNETYNKNYSDEVNINSKTYYKIDSNYQKIGDKEVWNYRFCIDKQTKEIYIEFKNNIGNLIKYDDYNKNIKYALDIIKNIKGYHISHVDVSIENNIYMIHLYEVIKNDGESHTATMGWYTLNLENNQLKDFMTDEILN